LLRNSCIIIVSWRYT